jgi:CheY-like chemotaxis protein
LHASLRVTRGRELIKPLVGVSVLIVDASVDAREALEAALAYCGALVALAVSASDAVDLYRRTPPHVVVVGSHLPEGEVTTLVRELHALAGASGPVPVVAVGRPDAERGFHIHVRTPVDPRDFCRLVAGLARKA